MHGNRMEVYQQTSVTTAEPGRLILMCYEEVIRNLKLAREKYISRNYEEKAQALNRALNIIDELNYALDFKNGAEIALNLHKIYNFISRSLIEADLKKDINTIDAVISMLIDLKSSWEHIQKVRFEKVDKEKRYVEDFKINFSTREMRI